MQLVDQSLQTGIWIRAVAADGIRIGDKIWTGGVLIQTGHETIAWDAPPLESFTAVDAARLLERRADLVILGCGDTQGFAPPAFAAELMRHGVGLECMPHAAAARTFNLLLSESRNVLGAFLPPA